MTKSKLRIEFGQPDHGWLPVDVRHGDFALQFVASDVPVNPIDQLMSAIRLLSKGMPSEVWWHLEPEGYYFDFTNDEEAYRLTISFAKWDTARKEVIYETHGTYEDIVMPFYRAIKLFFSQTIDETHWPKTDERDVKAFANLVKGTV